MAARPGLAWPGLGADGWGGGAGRRGVWRGNDGEEDYWEEEKMVREAKKSNGG